MSTAEYQRRWRARQSGRAGQPGRPWDPGELRPCGTVAAYRRHLRHQELTCQACRAAWADYRRERRTT